MRGLIKKMDDKWFISYSEQETVIRPAPEGTIGNYTMTYVNKMLPLHPSDVKEFNELNNMFDYLDARILSKPNVEFDIVTEEGINYAKLITK